MDPLIARSWAGAACLTAALALPATVRAEQAFDFDIPAQPLSSALNAFAAKVDAQMSYPASLAEGLKSPGVSGRYTAEEALQRLLKGTGIGHRFTGNRTITLDKMPVVKPTEGKSGETYLPKVTVTGAVEKPAASLTNLSVEEAQAKLERVPGGTSLIEGKRIKEGAAFTVNDALAYAPGVYVGDSMGGVNGGSRISVRGSDIASSISPIKGIKLLRNGMPFTNANGMSDTESLNLYPIQHIEVYRGANALEYGASTLGGAINFVTPTGYTADPLKVGMTLGTNGYVNPAVSGGGVLGGGWDAYGSFSYVNFNGNLRSTDQELFYGYGNLGYRWNETNETRLHVDIQDHDFHQSFGLTKKQLEENPHQTTSNRNDPPSGFPVHRVDLQHTVKLDGGDRLDFGAYYFNKEFSFNFQDFGFFHDLWQDAGFSWRHQINGELWGMKNRVVWGGLTQWMWINDEEMEPVGGQPGFLRFNERDDWNNVEAYVEDQLDLTDTLTLVAGAQVAYRQASFEHKVPAVAPGEPSQGDQDFFGFNPKVGLIWQATPSFQLYGNVSRSFEPPPLSDLRNVFQTPRLVEQTGTTVEIGTRGQWDGVKWDLAFYHAWMEDELLVVPIPPTFTNFSTTNASNTHHTGIELGLESALPLRLFNTDDQLRLRGSYTWSRFQFRDDPNLGDNRLPGIPEHNARFEALYQHPSGFYAGPNVTAVSSNWVDFTNTLDAKPYALLGARVGWDDGKHWKVFVDGRNLTNEHYAASVFVMGDAKGQDRAQFNPGATRMVFGGFEYRY